jgi:superfamily II DNA or RNA helicase
MELREYQKQAVEKALEFDRGLTALATGLGKTLVAQEIIRRLNLPTLFIAHRRELVSQFKEGVEFDCKVDCYTIQSLLKAKNLGEYKVLIIDEAHRYAEASKWGQRIKEINADYIYGFTATPYRSSGESLEWLFERITYQKDLKWGIENGFLTRLKAETINIGYDLSNVKMSQGDFAIGELEKAVNIESANEAIKEIFEKAPKPVIIFATGIEHAESLSKKIGIPAITEKTKKREEILSDFKTGKLEGLININIYTEGVNANNALSLIMARPTQSPVLFMQVVGRVVRLHPGKTEAYLYDLCGNVGKHSLCGVHTLLGLDIDHIPEIEKVDLIGDLLEDIPDIIEKKFHDPKTFIKNRKIVDLFRQRHKLKLYGLEWIKLPDGELLLGIPDNGWVGITPINKMKKCNIITSKGWKSKEMSPQEAIDTIIVFINNRFKDKLVMMKRASINKWGKDPGTQAQKGFAYSLRPGDYSRYDKAEMAIIINRLKMEKFFKDEKKN